MKTLKVKILGNGGAAQKHKNAFAELPEMYQITNSDDYDIVDICTPNYLHYDQICSYISTYHVIVEKPLCGSLTEIDNLIRIETRGNCKIFPIFQYRYAGHDLFARSIINFWRRDKSYYDSWRGKWDQALGGCLTSHAIHAIDLFLQYNQMPLMVSAGLNTHSGPETLADIFLGEPGDMFRISAVISPHVSTRGFNFGDQQRGFVEQFRRIHTAITEDEVAPVTLQEARNSLEILTAAYYSAYIKEPVMLPIEQDHPFYPGWTKHFAQPALRIPVSR